MIKDLDQICNFLSGNAWKAADFQDSGVPIIRINNMNSNDNEFVYWQDDYDKKYLIRNDDLLLSLSGTIKVHKWEGPEALLNQRIVKITAQNNVDVNIDWIYYQLLHSIEIIANKGKNAVIRNVSINDLKSFKVDLPDIHTQNKIVSILDKARALISKREHSIKLLDELLRATFLDMFGSYLKNSDKSNFDNLINVSEITAGITKGRKTKEKEFIEVPYLRVANVQDGYLNLLEIKTIEATRNEINQYQIHKYDIFLTEGGDPDKLGRGAIWEEEDSNYIFQNHLFRVRVKSQINPYWLLQLIGSSFGKQYFLRQAKQTTGIATINSRQVKQFPVPRVPIDLQQKFEKYFHSIKNRITKSKEILALSKILMGSISQRAFNGDLNFNIDTELDSLLNEIDLQKKENNLSKIVGDEVYLQRLIDKLNTQEFKEKELYDKAKHGVFQLLKEGTKVFQKYNEQEKSIQLALT